MRTLSSSCNAAESRDAQHKGRGDADGDSVYLQTSNVAADNIHLRHSGGGDPIECLDVAQQCWEIERKAVRG